MISKIIAYCIVIGFFGTIACLLWPLTLFLGGLYIFIWAIAKVGDDLNKTP